MRAYIALLKNRSTTRTKHFQPTRQIPLLSFFELIANSVLFFGKLDDSFPQVSVWFAKLPKSQSCLFSHVAFRISNFR